MITLAYEPIEGKSTIKEFTQGKSAAKYLEKLVPKDIINSITQDRCTAITWGDGTLECDVPFNSFIKKPVYVADEPDRSYRKTKQKR